MYDRFRWKSQDSGLTRFSVLGSKVHSPPAVSEVQMLGGFQNNLEP
jgi:hypothetical protein